mmetsp:Transcript_16850/g.48413  ORF Transcript_16850/g.48413 Transcript_16850/m.48413 type:complete len:83 (+) Transcript_16850:2848-3096(+)
MSSPTDDAPGSGVDGVMGIPNGDVPTPPRLSDKRFMASAVRGAEAPTAPPSSQSSNTRRRKNSASCSKSAKLRTGGRGTLFP